MTSTINSTDPVIFNTLPTQDDHLIGQIILNAEKSLNALSLEMVDLITDHLKQWQDDDRIKAIVLRGAGEKALCAGGDIVQLYKSMVETDFTSFESLSSNSYAESFFTREYQLNYLIHCYPKPIICWGNGIIMGGGLGIMAGASHRIVTETARIAMPEITIGLFPDVGGSYFLNRMSGQCGLFVALTGSSLNAADALYANLADAFLPSNLYQKLLSSLCHLNWLDDGQESLHRIIDHLLKQLLEEEVASSSTCPALPTGQLEPLQSYIDNLIVPDSLSDTIQAILNQPQDVLQNNRWLQKGVDSLRKGCPTTAHIIYHQLIRGKNMALADIFEMERRIAIQCCRKGEFQEGVRALLIDKDGNPNWQFPNYEDVPTDWVESFFHSPNI